MNANKYDNMHFENFLLEWLEKICFIKDTRFAFSRTFPEQPGLGIEGTILLHEPVVNNVCTLSLEHYESATCSNHWRCRFALIVWITFR